ncbi:MAG: methionine adenosyltransferase [Chlorobiaceae bacterium]|nr:methionine adenosyltransferase [Chlorobiaceae bacterium]MBA4309808.1 methionine adenosyltransferase [Chlorobiaceae bacterium]
MSFYFTSESVSEGHPDKVSDAISDGVLDAIYSLDPKARVACETFVTTGLVVVGGEVTTTAYVDIQAIVRETVKKIGYTKGEYMFAYNSCSVLNAIHSQSPDIAQGVEEGKGLFKEQGAGDQGMMFGFACDQSANYMPLTLEYSHRLVEKLSSIRKKQPKLMPYLRPDAKSQVTIEYDEKTRKPLRVDTIVVSTQHDENVSQKKIADDVKKYVIPAVIPAKMLDKKTKYYINPTGKFVIGGPHGDSGLTGRKIIVDTYGGWGAHGGGAFSGKDPSKVDRSAAYAARHIAKNIVAAKLAKECLVQVSYAIGVAHPMSIYVNTYGTGVLPDSKISEMIQQTVPMTPKAIIERLKLRNPIYQVTSSYGHFGRNYQKNVKAKIVVGEENGKPKFVEKTVELFTWEQLDLVPVFKKWFNNSVK